MKTDRICIVALLALFALGCGGPKAKEAGPEDPNVNSGVTLDQKPEVPEALKHAAYDYLGLGNGALMTYTVEMTNSLGPDEGTQQVTLEDVKDGVATYKVVRTGGLSQLGLDTRELREDGVYTVASSMGVLKAPSLEVPADLGEGKEWRTRMDMENLEGGTKKVESEVVNKATKTESVTVPGGTFECIVIESTINATVSGSPMESQNGKSVTKFTSYYSKGVGLIKLTGSTTMKDGKKSNVNITLKAIEEEEESSSPEPQQEPE